MSSTGKILHKGQVTIPTVVRRQAGLSEGDLVTFAFQRGKIIITPVSAVKENKFSTREEDTPTERRALSSRLAEARKGPYYGPFRSGTEIEAFLKKWKARDATRPNKPVRLKKTG